MKKEELFQEIFLKLKLPKGLKINKRTFAWRKENFNAMFIKNVSVEDGEVSFTSEFNAKFSKEEIKNFIDNKSYFSTGEGLSLERFNLEVIEIKEEAEIYSND